MPDIIQLQIIGTAILVCVACVLPGTFLVLRGIALMSDAISHAILLGITLMFFLVRTLNSPLLMVGAALAGLLTVACTQGLIRTRRVKEDAAIGLVFPLFFSIGVILISLYARNVHLDSDMVLLGEIGFAPFNRMVLSGIDCGPISFWVMGVIALMNSLFVRLFYKELTFATFDEDAASTLGIWPAAVYYGLMSMTSITAVGAFDIVGSIVVVALMVAPAAAAYLYATQLHQMIGLALVFGVCSAILGCLGAFWMDVSIAGSIAVSSGLIFLVSFLFAPHKGLFGRIWSERRHRATLSQKVLLAVLEEHPRGLEVNALSRLLAWPEGVLVPYLEQICARGLVERSGGRYWRAARGGPDSL